MEIISTLNDAQELISSLVLAKPDKRFVPSYLDALKEGIKPSRYETIEEEITSLRTNPDVWKCFSETCENAVGTDDFCLEDLFWLTKSDLFIGYIVLTTNRGPNREKHGGNTGRQFRPSERGKGYGTIALEMTKAIAKNRGYSHLEMVTSIGNLAAIKPWQKCGGILIEEIAPSSESYFSDPAVKYKIELKGA